MRSLGRYHRRPDPNRVGLETIIKEQPPTKKRWWEGVQMNSSITSDYLNEPITVGREETTRGQFIADMQEQGTPQEQIDAYLMGYNTQPEASVLAEVRQDEVAKAAKTRLLKKNTTDVQSIVESTFRGEPAWGDGFMADKGEVPPILADKNRRTIQGTIDPLFDNLQGDGVKAIPIGTVDVGEFKFVKAYVVLSDESAQQVTLLDQKYFGYFNRKYGDPEFLVRSATAPVEIKVGGESVGLVMPMRMEADDAWFIAAKEKFPSLFGET